MQTDWQTFKTLVLKKSLSVWSGSTLFAQTCLSENWIITVYISFYKLLLMFVQENYGKPEEEKVQKVKELYKDLDLEKAFQDFEESSYGEILLMIDAYHGKLPKELFIAFTNKIYKRDKWCSTVIVSESGYGFEPHEKTCLLGLRPGKTRTGLIRYRS